MAKPPTKPTTEQPVATVEAAVLRDCGFGAVGTVVDVSEADAQAGEAHGLLDTHPAAIAHIKSQA